MYLCIHKEGHLCVALHDVVELFAFPFRSVLGTITVLERILPPSLPRFSLFSYSKIRVN